MSAKQYWKEEPKDAYPCSCHLCGVKIMNVEESHNPYPLVTYDAVGGEGFAPGLHGPRCCFNCNTQKVVPMRLLQFEARAKK
jgi:hypothetical protein